MSGTRGPGGGRRGGQPAFQEQIRHTRTELRQQVRATRAQFDQANARITARTGRNLVFAIAVGLGLGGSLVLSLVLAKQLFLVVAIVLVAFGTFELAGALRHAGRIVPRAGSAVAGVLAMPVVYIAESPAPGGAGAGRSTPARPSPPGRARRPGPRRGRGLP